WQSAMQSNDGPRGDIRYSSSGNRVVGRSSVPATAAGVPAIPLLTEITNTVSTAMYRHDAQSDDPTFFTDMYSPRLDRDTIRPGTVAYDVNGHVAMVWKVEEGGRIMIFSSHPDNTLDRTFVGREFLRTGPELGSIFQNWRPIRLVGARQLANGTFVGGRIVGTPNSEIAGFSLEQYVGNPPVDPSLWGVAKFVKDNEAMDFYTYLRARLSIGELEYKPVEETHVMMQTLCQDLRARKQAVEISRNEGRTHLMSQPDRLPRNIYGTDGVWELYSTPSRDARLKTAFKEMHDQIREFIRMKETDAPRLQYRGDDLPRDILRAYDEENAACPVVYRKTDGTAVRLTIDDIVRRLFKLSFDPYHCVERRWGATDGAELASCPDGSEKTRWYEAEQPLRNQIDRTYDVEMDSTVEELEQGPYGVESGRGVAQAPEVDIRAYLVTHMESRSALK
ncbi:hypothetical protein, partial [Parvibaculum sp.]|uniref:hypothetical protein n=1 Tax=Parvibaculum sp. TaxID=2024848 RepID=UPI002CC3B24B